MVYGDSVPSVPRPKYKKYENCVRNTGTGHFGGLQHDDLCDDDSTCYQGRFDEELVVYSVCELSVNMQIVKQVFTVFTTFL